MDIKHSFITLAKVEGLTFFLVPLWGKVGKLKRRETKQCNFFLLFAFPKGDFFVLLWFRLPLFLPKEEKKSRDKEKKGNKKKEETPLRGLFRSPLVKKQGFFSPSGTKRRETNETPQRGLFPEGNKKKEET